MPKPRSSLASRDLSVDIARVHTLRKILQDAMNSEGDSSEVYMACASSIQACNVLLTKLTLLSTHDWEAEPSPSPKLAHIKRQKIALVSPFQDYGEA